MRCFIAIDIEQNVKKQIASAQKSLAKELALDSHDAKWIDTDLMHLTLKFLGDIDDESVLKVSRIVKEAADDHRQFAIDLKGLGSFGSPARVIWAGIEPNEALRNFQSEIDDQLTRQGYPGDEKGFTSHLTICRVKKFSAGKRLKEYIKKYSDQSFGTSNVDAVCLYCSELTPKGPIYKIVSKVKFLGQTG